MRFAGRLLAGWRRWAARFAALVAGFVVAGFLWTETDRISMARFEAAFAPLVAEAHAQAAAPCPPAARYTGGTALAGYIEESSGPSVPLKLHHGGGRFVLSAGGRSIDIDGSTLYYDSQARKWTKFHNDNEGARGIYDALLQGLAECRIPLR